MDPQSQIYQTPQLAPDDESHSLKFRQPLSDSAGNSQLHTLASAGHYHENKGLQQPVGRFAHSVPTLLSQPHRQYMGNAPEIRRRNIRMRRRYPRRRQNPIVNSPQYQAYRNKQKGGGKADDAKWPIVLEDAFLDGMRSSDHCLLLLTIVS